ncbi:EamA family transporter [Microbacterium sp. Bi121]|uniref:EamA family transporter n=1 Tax=Microbacterium sp. Bi121 TaxID=2822348 RepID=UPI001E421B2B|nr:EamA family transporter [Microbacterium sp. Bi121]
MASNPSSRPAVGVALVVGSCLSLPFGAAVAAQLFPALGAWGVTSLRIGLAAVLLLVFVRPRVRGWTRRQWGAAVLFGVSLAGMNGFFYAGIERVPLGPAVAIEFLGPLILAAVLTRRLLDGMWVGIALIGMALLGLDGMLGAEPLDLLGVFFILIAAGFWVFYIRMSARVGEAIPGSGGLVVGLLVASVLLLPVGIPTVAAVGASGDMSLLLLALLTAVLSSVIPYSFELAALRRLPQRVFGVLLSLEPAFATLAGWLVLGQSATPLKLLAIGLVVAASVGTALGARRDAKGAEPPPFTGTIPVVPN